MGFDSIYWIDMLFISLEMFSLEKFGKILKDLTFVRPDMEGLGK